ncbi:hypothetical protein FRC03_004542 [Tulasnella sp. 419]|nr:hypothetical protein FRC03_004542 [Tulasnella sp. 419]
MFVKVEFNADIYTTIYEEHLANLQALDEAVPDPFTAMLGSELWEKCSDGLLPEDEDSQQSRATITEKQKADAICDAKERRERIRLEQEAAERAEQM